VAKGAALYKKNCAGCHLPPVNELVEDLNSKSPRNWWKNSLGKMFLKITDVPIEVVGTDPHEAKDFMARTAETGDLNKGTVSAAVGLDLITRGIADRFYAKAAFPQEKRDEWNGFHADGDPAVRAIAVYKARPLNGIWAVAPYLHNGSVPNLYSLLSPKSERPATFWLGSKRYDPEKVGFDTSELEGGYLFETQNPGNDNGGHEFNEGPRKNGVIGPLLSHEDRMCLIEFLKSM